MRRKLRSGLAGIYGGEWIHTLSMPVNMMQRRASKRRAPLMTRGMLTLTVIVLLLAGCAGQEQGRSENDKPQIVASIYPLYEFATRVAGERADVALFVPSGVEPHDWEPTAQDMVRLNAADMLIYNGAGMESWLEQVVSGLNKPDLTLVEASLGLELLAGDGHVHDHGDEAAHGHDHEDEHGEEAAHGHDHEDEHGEEAAHGHDHEDEHGEEAAHGHDHDHGPHDPHVWLSPVKAAEQVKLIEAALSQAFPEHASEFRENAVAYIAELEALDERFRAELAPHQGKTFVTQHAAFRYLAHEYGLVQLPIAGLSPDVEPTARQMAGIIDFAREHDVHTVFFEPGVSSRIAETIAAEIGAETAILHPLEFLTAAEAESGLTYIRLMEQNLQALLQSFERKS